MNILESWQEMKSAEREKIVQKLTELREKHETEIKRLERKISRADAEIAAARLTGINTTVETARRNLAETEAIVRFAGEAEGLDWLTEDQARNLMQTLEWQEVDDE